MNLHALGYIGVGSKRLADWKEFGSRIVGLQCAEETGSLIGFRMDDRKRRIIVDQETADGSCFFGWEVAGPTEMEAMAAHLEQSGVSVTREPDYISESRCVSQVLSFSDPAGNRLEVFHGAQTDDNGFTPGRTISGFRTGALGLGHAVLTVERIDDILPFYRDVLGFGLSDYMLAPFKAFFLHINPRHHSLALIETGKNGVHHVMMEHYSLDDVGQAYDLAIAKDCVNVTLGRHSNDYMTSFYARTPSPFMIECGWGGREIDPRNWTAKQYHEGPSLWGHERTWLPPEIRAQAQEMRIEAAANGIRHPVQVIKGNYDVMSGECPEAAE